MEFFSGNLGINPSHPQKFACSYTSGVASPKILGGKMPDFRRITLFCLEKRLSKHKMAIFSKNSEGHGPFFPPGYAYVLHL